MPIYSLSKSKNVSFKHTLDYLFSSTGSAGGGGGSGDLLSTFSSSIFGELTLDLLRSPALRCFFVTHGLVFLCVSASVFVTLGTLLDFLGGVGGLGDGGLLGGGVGVLSL